MQSLNVVFHVSLNKLLNKPAYDVTVMDDLALGGASLLSAHYVPVYLKQSCWHKFVDDAKTDRTSNGSWCIGIKGEMSGTVCVTFTWDIYIYMSCLQLLFVLLFVHYCNVMVYVVYSVASGKQEKVQACLVTLWLFIISCHSLYKTTLGSLCSWKPAWSLKKRPHSMCLKPFVKMCIFVVIQIFWSLRKYREQ